MQTPIWIWVLFHLFIFAMLALDLGVFHRRKHVVHWREALVWTGVWVMLTLCFNLGVYFWRGKETALAFMAGYLIEKSLSIDNIFVFFLIFSYFKVPAQYQHKVLHWGILSALFMRGTFIFLGLALIERFHWVLYLFGVFLLLTGIKMFMQTERELHPERNPVLKLMGLVLPIKKECVSEHFFVKDGDRRWATPLFVTLIFLETTDVLFAIDSIPAVISVSSDPFIIYTSNTFAILGLRSLYFAVSGATDRFGLLKYGLAAILIFVGLKMLFQDLYAVPIGVSLGVIASFLILSILLSRLA